MSLEQAIQENTAAIKALIAALGTGATSQAAAPVETAPVEEPKAEKPTKEKKQSAPAATPESKEEVAPAADEPAPVSYDDCAQSVTKLAKSKGRPAAVALLGQFDLKTLQDAKDKPELLAQVKAAADAELGE
jgi:hypothetical protein